VPESTQPPEATAATPDNGAGGTPVGTPAGTGLSEVTVSVVENPELGPILVDGEGRTLYAFMLDGPNQSNCDANCQKDWPPLITQGSPAAGEGADANLIGVAELADGRLIVTYNQMPLYYWHADAQPGDTGGQGVDGVWFVVAPNGTPVGPQPAAQPTQPPAPQPDNNDSGGDMDY
jgi:predicted lipoprotein with Yx(FWY)xxD motif